MKWQYQPQQRSRSWLAIIRIQRRDTQKLIQENPSLKPCLKETIQYAFENGRDLAIAETDLPDQVFPEQCPYTVDDVLNGQFFPGDPSDLIDISPVAE